MNDVKNSAEWTKFHVVIVCPFCDGKGCKMCGSRGRINASIDRMVGDRVDLRDLEMTAGVPK
jgi:hypothetical protein